MHSIALFCFYAKMFSSQRPYLKVAESYICGVRVISSEKANLSRTVGTVSHMFDELLIDIEIDAVTTYDNGEQVRLVEASVDGGAGANDQRFSGTTTL